MDRGRIGMFLLAQLAGEDRVALAKDSGLTCLHVGANTGDGKDSIKAVKMATTVLSTLPILCIYPFVQKFFTQGVMVGSVKG